MSPAPLRPLDHRFCVAPMMDWTTRHCRAFHRTLTKGALLYSEMVTAEALLHGDPKRLIGFDACEHPVALQIGGSDPARLAAAARIGTDFGYDEINLNVGCPSDRVQSGRFGACLMQEPALVGDCVDAMRAACALPITVKNRIGVDAQDPWEALFEFTRIVSEAGARIFIVHARKALLQGLSPKENREVPPLDYDIVRALKRQYPHLTIVLNGGLTDLEQAKQAGEGLDGVMLGRAAYHDPALLGQVDKMFLGASDTIVTPQEAYVAFRPYVAAQLAQGVPLHAMTRHMLGLFAGQPGARLFRRFLSENSGPAADIRTYDSALEIVLAAQQQAARTRDLQAHV